MERVSYASDDIMPALKEHLSSDKEYKCKEFEYVLEYKDEENKKTYLFKNMDVIDPRKECNVIHLQEESNDKSKMRKSDKDSGPPALIQPKEDSQDETSLLYDSFPELEAHESSRDDDLTTSKENNITNKRERIVKQKEVRTVMKARCNFVLEDKDSKLTKYLGLLDNGRNGSLIPEDLAGKYKMKRVSNRGPWKTNNGNFKTTSKVVAHSLTFL